MVLAGCATPPAVDAERPRPRERDLSPTPGTPWRADSPPAGPLVVTRENFTLTIEPGAIKGVPGETRSFSIRVEHKPGFEAWLYPRAWTRIAGADLAVRVQSNQTIQGEVLLGPAAAGDFRIRVGKESTYVDGPELWLEPAAPPVANLSMEARRDEADIPAGLHVAAEGSTVVATYSLGTSDADCDQSVRPIGNVSLQQGEGGASIFMFVSEGSSDDCWGNPPYKLTPRVVLTAQGLRADPVTVRLFTHLFGMAESGGWEEHDVVLRR
jgi:hypothetical protein